jgi:hypothetical protein
MKKTKHFLLIMSVITLTLGCLETITQRAQPFDISYSKGLFGGNLTPCPNSFRNFSWTNCYGKIIFPNGDKYIGEWNDDRKTGQGTLIFINGNKFNGQWVKDRKEGQGTSILANGDKYVGDWDDDKKDGKGTLTFANGDKYVGDWDDGKKDGEGT